MAFIEESTFARFSQQDKKEKLKQLILGAM